MKLASVWLNEEWFNAKMVDGNNNSSVSFAAAFMQLPDAVSVTVRYMACQSVGWYRKKCRQRRQHLGRVFARPA